MVCCIARQVAVANSGRLELGVDENNPGSDRLASIPCDVARIDEGVTCETFLANWCARAAFESTGCYPRSSRIWGFTRL
jgi:hypothetical protein